MYGSLADADIYFATYDLTETWDDYTDADKTKALNEATRQIDRLKFRGEKYQWSPTQTLQFPRMVYANCKTIYLDEDPSTGDVVVPEKIEHATYIQAKYLLDTIKGDDDTGDAHKAGITSVSIGSTSESYDAATSPINLTTGLVRDAWEMIREFLVVAW